MMGGSWEEDSSQFYNRKIGIIKRCLPSDKLSSSELDSSDLLTMWSNMAWAHQCKYILVGRDSTLFQFPAHNIRLYPHSLLH